MLWELLGAGPIGGLIMDIVFLLLGLGLLAYVFRIRRMYGAWLRLADCDHIVVAIGRDNQARLVCGERNRGIYLSLGDYGDVPLDGEAVYKIINVPQKNSLSMIYLPYALLLRAKEMAGIRKLERGEYRVVGKVIRIVERESGRVVYECRELKEGECSDSIKRFVEEYAARTGRKVEELDSILGVEEQPLLETEVDKPVVIRPEDIRNWQVYSFNPIILKSMNESYTIAEMGARKSPLGSPWLMILGIIAFVALVLAIIK